MVKKQYYFIYQNDILDYYNDIPSEMIIPILYYLLYLKKFNIFIFILFH